MNEREIFLALLDAADPAARVAYIDKVCGGDRALRARVEALLRSHETAGSFLDNPAVAPEDPRLWATEGFGDEESPGAQSGLEGEALSFLAPPGRVDSLGRIGHYEILEILGRGGFGIVFRAYDEALQRVVAIKVLAPRMAVASPARKRFLREARLCARVRHENIVQIHAVEEQPLPYLVMEFIPGETLQQRLDRTGPLEAEQVVEIGLQIARGLAAAHGAGLAHRDIKPGNILIETDRQHVKLTDFGLARAADDASQTQSQVVAGTPMFMSPEQARGEHIDHRTDLFSLGSVLYTMCSGRPPFRANGTLAILRRVAEDVPRPISEIIPETPAWLCDLVARLHAKRPEDRLASARDVADVLTRGQAGPKDLGAANPTTPSATCTSPTSAPRGRVWSVAVALLLILLGLGVSEATGVSNVHGTVIRLFSPEGTLVVEVDEPGIGLAIDGEEMILTGAGASQIRLKPGQHVLRAIKNGQTMTEELVTIVRNGKQVVRVSREALSRTGADDSRGKKPLPADAELWERSVAALPVAEQVEAVAARLKQLNPGFDGAVSPTIEKGAVNGLRLSTVHVTDISPVRAFKELKSLVCAGIDGEGTLADLSPLRGMQLTALACNDTRVADLSPLRGMRLKELYFQHTSVPDLAPLAGMPLLHLNCSDTPVAELSPLKGMPLLSLYLDATKATDLTPLKGLPLRHLNYRGCKVQKGRESDVLRSLVELEDVNGEPVAEFLKSLDAEQNVERN